MANPATIGSLAALDAVAGRTGAVGAMDGPRGRRPKRPLSRGNIILYGTLILVSVYYLLPLWVMVVTSLKGMPEIRMGNVFGPPMEITFEPWVKAWSEACTGL